MRAASMMCSRHRQRSVLVVLAIAGLCFVIHLYTTAYTDVHGGGKIILMTYGRSGSSFTSAVIERHPDVFYTFEPFYNLMLRHLGRRYGRKHFVYPEQNQAEYERESISIMKVFLTCAFESLNIADMDNLQLKNANDSRLLWGCTQVNDSFTPVDVLRCFLAARQACLSKPVKMVKTIRFRATAAAAMMAGYSDLKILYLVRDPRGTIFSQKRVFKNFGRTQLANFTDNFCQIFRDDLADLEPLFDKYPGRIKLLRYETLAENAMEVSQEIYQFLGLDFTPDVRVYVHNMTSARRSPKGNYATSKADSAQAAYSWRDKITLDEAQTIYNTCQDVCRTLGYLPVTSLRHLRDWNHSLRTHLRLRRHVVLGE